jgi:hypothetical protein
VYSVFFVFATGLHDKFGEEDDDGSERLDTGDEERNTPHLARKWKFVHIIKSWSGGDLSEEARLWAMPYTEFLVHCNYNNDIRVQEINKKMG